MPRRPGHTELLAALAAQDPDAEPEDGVLAQLVRAVAAAAEPDRTALKIACRASAQLLADRAPGRSVELRIPPYAAVQCVAGPRHTRGTPPNVVEVQPHAWVRLAAGTLDWAAAVADGRVAASGERSDLSEHLPLI